MDYNDLEYRVSRLEDKSTWWNLISFIVFGIVAWGLLLLLWGSVKWAMVPISDFLFANEVIEYEMYSFLYDLSGKGD